MKNNPSTMFMICILFIAQIGLNAYLFAINKSDTDEKWLNSVIKSRQEKDIEFKTSPTSPMAAVKRLTVINLENAYIVNQSGDFSISKQNKSGTCFSLVNEKGKWIWNAIDPDVSCRISNKEVASGSKLEGQVQFKVGECTLSAYPSPKGLVLLVFDPQRPVFKQFSHLIYYKPNPGFAVPAKVVKFKEPQPITVLTSRNLEKTYYKYATVHFRVNGKELKLTALKYSLTGEGSDALFIPFGDETNGKETYGSGRFMDVQEPSGDEFILDFNTCYNPLCNYAHDAYNCPLPPFENILEVSIEAGERIYPH